jgi:integrase/recombinase XerD
MPQFGDGEVDAFRFYLVAAGKSQATIKNYVQAAELFTAWCISHEISPFEAQPSTLMRYLGELSIDHARSTVRLYVICLRVWYDFLVKSKYVTTNPAREIAVTKQVTPPTEIISDTELVNLLNACESAVDRAMILLLLGGGLRRSELHGIRAEHCNFDAGTVTIFGKGSKYRQVAPGRVAMEALRMALWRRDRLFVQEDNDYIWRRVKRLWKLAGNKGNVYPHRFRHTFAVKFSENGGGVDLLMTILGHSSLQMAMYYSRAGIAQRALRAQVEHNPADRLVG